MSGAENGRSDEFFANCDKVTADLNGDNVFSKEDRFGYAYWQGNAAFAFIYSTGNSLGEIRNGEPGADTVFREDGRLVAEADLFHQD